MGWCYLLNGLLSPAVIVQYLLRAVVVLITIRFTKSAHAGWPATCWVMTLPCVPGVSR